MNVWAADFEDSAEGEVAFFLRFSKDFFAFNNFNLYDL